MINQAAIHITQTLESIPAILAYFGEDIFWELAEEKTVAPYLVFSIEMLGSASKDQFNDYNVQIRVFDVRLSDAALISEVIVTGLAEGSRWRSKGIRSGYSDTSAKEGFIELTYNFKI